MLLFVLLLLPPSLPLPPGMERPQEIMDESDRLTQFIEDRAKDTLLRFTRMRQQRRIMGRYSAVANISPSKVTTAKVCRDVVVVFFLVRVALHHIYSTYMYVFGNGALFAWRAFHFF